MKLQLSTLKTSQAILTLPKPFKNGVGVSKGYTIYLGLGNFESDWYCCDLSTQNKEWKKLASFPEPNAYEQASAAIIDNDIYIFGGVSKNEDNIPQVFPSIFKYSILNNSWTKLSLEIPQATAGHCSLVYNQQILLVGGVNQKIFNNLFLDIFKAEDDEVVKQIIANYLQQDTNYYKFNSDIIVFDPQNLTSSILGTNPYFGTAGAALVKNETGFVLINGERKPGLRTDKVFSVDLTTPSPTCNELATVNSPDGVAGAFAAAIKDIIITAGGATFLGSTNNYQAGILHSHKDLDKHYNRNIFAYTNSKWQKIGELPFGLAYGVTLTFQNGILIIGGETIDSQATDNILYLDLK